MTHYDIALIGNGMLALSTAYALSNIDSSLKIAIIGPQARTGGASRAAGAMLGVIGEVTTETLKNPYHRQKLNIGLESAILWPNLLAELNDKLAPDQQIDHRNGTFVILNAKSGTLDTDNYLAIMEAAAQYQQPCQEVNPKDVVGLQPLDDCRPLRALYLAREGMVDANALLAGLTAVLEKTDSITFVTQSVQKIVAKHTDIHHLELENGQQIFAEKFLLAAGSYSQHLLDQLPELAARIPRLLAGNGVSIVMRQSQPDAIQHVIRTPNRSGACGLHVLPRGTENLYVGATNNILLHPSTKQKLGLSQFLLQCAIDQIDQNLYRSELLSWTVGNRPVTLDTFPIAGATSMNNLWVLCGTYRDGLQQSPYWGQYIAKSLMNQSVPSLPFKPERSLIQVVDKKETTIAETAKHYMAGFYEHGMRLPRLLSEKQMEAMLRRRFDDIYEALGTDFPLIPDVFFMFELSDDNDQNIALYRDYFAKMQMRSQDSSYSLHQS